MNSVEQDNIKGMGLTLLSIGALLAVNLKPDDFTKVKVKEVSVVLPIALIENKLLLSFVISILSPLFQELIYSYIKLREVEGENLDKLVSKHIEEITEIISGFLDNQIKTLQKEETNTFRIGDFIIPIKK